MLLNKFVNKLGRKFYPKQNNYIIHLRTNIVYKYVKMKKKINNDKVFIFINL